MSTFVEDQGKYPRGSTERTHNRMEDVEDGYTSSEEDCISSDEEAEFDVYTSNDQADTSSDEESVNDVYHMEAGECYMVIDMYLEGNDNDTYLDGYYTEI